MGVGSGSSVGGGSGVSVCADCVGIAVSVGTSDGVVVGGRGVEVGGTTVGVGGSGVRVEADAGEANDSAGRFHVNHGRRINRITATINLNRS
jgi:hypothetical protein